MKTEKEIHRLYCNACEDNTAHCRITDPYPHYMCEECGSTGHWDNVEDLKNYYQLDTNDDWELEKENGMAKYFHELKAFRLELECNQLMHTIKRLRSNLEEYKTFIRIAREIFKT